MRTPLSRSNSRPSVSTIQMSKDGGKSADNRLDQRKVYCAADDHISPVLLQQHAPRIMEVTPVAQAVMV